MSTFLPPDVQAGLDAARKAALKKSSRLRIRAGDDVHPVLRTWKNGFALDAEEASHLRGRVDLYDGSRLISQCLIIASDEDGGEIHFEYKQMTEATDTQPLDFYRAPDAPIALLGDGS